MESNEPNINLSGMEHLQENFKLQEWLSQLPKTKKVIALAIYEEEDEVTYLEGYTSSDVTFAETVWALELYKHQLLSGDPE